MGGSELILANLRLALPQFFPVFDDPAQDLVQIIVSRPQQVTLDPAKPKILWLQDLAARPGKCLSRGRHLPLTVQQDRLRLAVASAAVQRHSAHSVGELTVIKNAVPRLTPQFPKRDPTAASSASSTPRRRIAGWHCWHRRPTPWRRSGQDWELACLLVPEHLRLARTGQTV
jgi:hypothetical protein